MEKLQSTADDEFNRSETENGAVGYRTTGQALLDLNFAVSSLRNVKPVEVVKKFSKAFFENKLYAVKWLFFAGDVRGGMGERRLFRLCMEFLTQTESELARALLPLIPEYTRWDNVIELFDTALQSDTIKLVQAQLSADVQAESKKQSISLLAKWLPSINATSKSTREKAKLLTSALGMTAKQYRKTLSSLREYLDVTEVKMSANKWKKIRYEAVPSKANLLYGKAFMNHDEKRRTKYLDDLKNGKTKINASVLFPHDIVNEYMGYFCVLDYDETLEQLWKALPDYVQGDSTTLCVADGSASMTCGICGSKATALDVANALAIYFSERCKGQFKDTYITFSENPQIVSFAHCKSLHDKLGVALTHNEVANTNIEAVFDLILTTAVKHKMKQDELPQNVLILSDMEFDECSVTNDYDDERDWRNPPKLPNRLFEVIGAKYEAHGYKLPRLVFWNIASRSLTIPLTTNALGVALVSGFSPTSVRMVLSGNLDPYQCLLEQINAPRYAAVEEAFKAQ